MIRSIDMIKKVVRRGMKSVAKMLDTVSGGRITPNGITWFGFLMHIPIAGLIATGHLVEGGLMLIVFGLFDALDGELARLQDRVSDAGGLLDASTDRFKEVLLYGGIAYFFASGPHPEYAVVAVVALGASICVSYVKAKGESIVAAGSKKIPYPVLNRMFSGGILPFETRMALLVIGLLSGQLIWVVAIIAILSTVTAFQRLILIGKNIA